MTTYDNANTGVVHWVADTRERPWQTACFHMNESTGRWNEKLYDPVGAPADVTCCKCRETAAWLDALDAAESEVGDDEPSD